MAVANYRVVRAGEGWAIERDGLREGDYLSKEAALEAIVAAASNTIRNGDGVRIEVPERVIGEASLGVPSGA